ncbi:hypothetical protein AC623_16265 [Bacillus sp. FJAT-27231]|uniref:copper amine oxidase N-terminal domain-containing protein n=1 Tax=Bacillus sp. FJAT-27231 TaxID=1679168 RepID=UPI000670EA8E|nr:copper amine oxidase N-terminal domain-containing protein [Bacillus sp. FJAT-27231]KMY55295.1 hypothetical protein AC623_16265 [Bacillus sp. FJAT-27231]
MTKKWMAVMLMMFLFFLSFSSGNFVYADDDDHERGGEHEEYHDGDDDEWEEENDEADSSYQQDKTSSSSWNIWTRDLAVAGNGSLPFQQAQEVNIRLNNQTQKVYLIPRNSQLFVSGEKLAQLIQADYKYYEQSRILEVSKGKEELIVRAGSNAAYENMVKTPMPSSAYFFEKSVYLPISVAANAFGYRLSWDENSDTIVLQEIL